MQTILTVIRYPNIKQNLELRSNGMAHQPVWIFEFFISHLYGIAAWQVISKKYNFILWFYFFLQIFDFKTWKIKPTSRKIYFMTGWDNHFLQGFSPSPPSILMGLQITREYTAEELLTHNIDIGEGDGALNGAIFKFF